MTEYQGINKTRCLICIRASERRRARTSKIRNLINTFWLYQFCAVRIIIGFLYCILLIHIDLVLNSRQHRFVCVHEKTKNKQKQNESMPSINKFRNFAQLTLSQNNKNRYWWSNASQFSDRIGYIDACIFLWMYNGNSNFYSNWACVSSSMWSTLEIAMALLQTANVHTNFVIFLWMWNAIETFPKTVFHSGTSNLRFCFLFWNKFNHCVH